MRNCNGCGRESFVAKAVGKMMRVSRDVVGLTQDEMRRDELKLPPTFFLLLYQREIKRGRELVRGNCSVNMVTQERKRYR